MNEEEIKAYNYLKKYIKWKTLGERNLEGDIKTILDLIKKQQNFIDEIEQLIYYTDDYVENIYSQIEDLLKDYGIERKFYNDNI